MPVEAPTPDVLFDASALGDWLGKSGLVTEARGTLVERVVWGWLAPELGLTARPSSGQPDYEQVFAWAIELGAIAYENPAGYSAKQLASSQQQFSAERRAQILAEARAAGDGSAAGEPQGSFPPAPVYPDPARW